MTSHTGERPKHTHADTLSNMAMYIGNEMLLMVVKQGLFLTGTVFHIFVVVVVVF